MRAVRAGERMLPLRVASRAIVARSGGSAVLRMGKLLRRGLDLAVRAGCACRGARAPCRGRPRRSVRPPASCMASTVSRQRTGRVKTSVSSARTSVNGSVVADEKTGKAGLVHLGLVERGAERLDGRLHARRVERAGDVERQHAAAVLAGGLLGRPASRSRGPDRMTWPGALSLATVTSAASAIARVSSSVAPISASIEPTVSASAISLPRSTTRRSASSRSNTPAAASAASSPSEWPAAGGRVEVERVPAGEAGAEDGGLGEAGGLAGARERDPHPRARCSARAARGRAPRRGPAFRVSGCPGRGRAATGAVGSVIKVTPTPCPAGYLGSQLSRRQSPRPGGWVPPPAADIR